MALVLLPYDTLLPYVLPYAPDCPEMLAINAIRNATIQFCTDSWYWQHDPAPWAGVVGQSDYQPDTPDSTKMVGVVNAWFDGKALYPVDNATVRRRFPYSDYRTEEGSPAFFMQPDENAVTLVPSPDTSAAGKLLTWRIAVAPVIVSTQANGDIFERHPETLAKGALARLKATPGQPYSDPQGALLLDNQFKTEITKVRAAVERGKTRGPIRVRFNGRNG